MIVVDSSALIAVLFGEPLGAACLTAIEENDVMMSSATLTEALIVCISRGHDKQLVDFIESAAVEIVAHTPALAYQSGEAFRQWGKGRHPARLNYGDCCAYALAKVNNCPLLFIGDDFSQTDIVSALPSPHG